MKVDGKPYRTIWLAADGVGVEIIDQTRLPHDLVIRRLDTVEAAAAAIRTMQVRGAPLIGATAAYGVALAMRSDASDAGLEAAAAHLAASRPTAVNLVWALQRMRGLLASLPPARRATAAYAEAARIAEEDVAINRAIGEHGFAVLERAAATTGGRALNVLTHCNAGWLATVDYGTALAPIYLAHDRGVPLHVWVDETRPRNQGASLTAWELGHYGVPHTVIVDNAGGHLMQHGRVDLCIVGTDRVSRGGDVCNKVGTYLKALAAADNGIPFYVAAPGPSIDWAISNGVAEIPIEERDGAEVTRIVGRDGEGRQIAVEIVPAGTAVANFGFDVTPARLVTGLITERGLTPAAADRLAALYPERSQG